MVKCKKERSPTPHFSLSIVGPFRLTRHVNGCGGFLRQNTDHVGVHSLASTSLVRVTGGVLDIMPVVQC